MKIKRGHIWWINLDPAVGSEIRKRRPCVVLSDDRVNEHRRTPIVVPLSHTGIVAEPITVPVPSAGPGAVAVIDQLRAVDKRRFVDCAGTLADAELKAVALAVKRILVLP